MYAPPEPDLRQLLLFGMRRVVRGEDVDYLHVVPESLPVLRRSCRFCVSICTFERVKRVN